MGNTLIPVRPDNDRDFTKITKTEKDCLVYTVLVGCKQEDAYALFHPHVIGPDGKMLSDAKVDCRQFFKYARNREYMDAYRETLERFISLSGSDVQNEIGEIDNKRKSEALKRLLLQAMRLVESGEDLTPDTLKVVTDIFNKLGFIKGGEDAPEKPRRYLPVRCISECQYRVLVERAIEQGEIENECEYCRALAFARKHGYYYDPTKNLNIPATDEVE